MQSSRQDLLPWMPWAVAPTLAGVSSALSNFAADWDAEREYHFSFFLADKLVGAGGINRLPPVSGRPAEAEIHYWMHSGFAGRGLATEACRAMLAFAFDSLQVKEVILLAGEGNLASLRVAEKLGFSFELTSPDGLLGSDGPFPTRHHRLKRGYLARQQPTEPAAGDS
ncbi:MAG: GNAT family N-acetyltransferase [Candidatus Dormibacteraeota bacterium]|nr:GNAT family N-acetyltransferase [Candidatus Dormibacteraeota bacterium]